MNKFKKNKYTVVRKVIDSNLADFLKDYLILKKKVAQTLFKGNYINPYSSLHGQLSDNQVKDTFAIYGDVAHDILLQKIKPVMEKHTGLKLIETYSYARLYKKGDNLKRHKDRFSCEISTTITLGGDDWPIYLEPSGEEGMKGIKVDLKPGDMLIYKGGEVEHWREPLEGDYCAQVFLHYNIEDEKSIKYDGRLHLGLPSDIGVGEVNESI
jgi:hypothetical protein